VIVAVLHGDMSLRDDEPDSNSSIGEILDEIEALRSIYPDLDITDLSDNQCKEIRLEINFHPTSGLVNLSLVMTEDYPSSKPPVSHFWAPNLKSGIIETINKRLRSIWEDFEGQPILYQWVEATLEVLQEINGSDVPEAASTNSCDEAIVPMTSLSLEAKEDATCPEIHTGPPIEDRKGVFQGHFATIHSSDQVHTVLAKLKSNPKIGRAFHNMWAYRIRTTNGQIAQDCDDDGEAHAGGRLSHLLDILDCSNHMVVVSRWYGGILLGPDRFKHINNAARSVMEQADAIPKGTPSGGKKGKKK